MGHHVQNLLGVSEKVSRAQAGKSQAGSECAVGRSWSCRPIVWPACGAFAATAVA
ncbi:hypothetical protein ACU4HD_25350 [Cupriavidus basilensis]